MRRGVSGKIILFARDPFSSLVRPFFEPSHLPKHTLVATVPQVVQFGFHPLRQSGLLFSRDRPAQFPHVLTGMIEVQ